MGTFYEANLIPCLLSTTQWLFKIITSILFENYSTTYVKQYIVNYVEHEMAYIL